MINRPVRLLALIGAILLGLAACGGDSGTTTPTLPTLSEADGSAPSATTTTTVAVDPAEAFQEYTMCMREQGIDMPDPTSDGGGAIVVGGGTDDLDFEAFEEAAEACDPILEGAFGEFEMTPEQEAELRDQELAFAQCMRDNGVDWPDPTGTGPGAAIEIGGDVDFETVNSAMDTCSKDVFGDAGGLVVGGEVTP